MMYGVYLSALWHQVPDLIVMVRYLLMIKAVIPLACS